MKLNSRQLRLLGLPPILIGFLLTVGIAQGYPDGAPWGASDPTASESCASCHYDYAPIMDSDAISIDGWPESVKSGATYEFTVRFKPASASSAGFLIAARSAGSNSGLFLPASDGIETEGSSARSTAPRAVHEYVSWTVEWRAPDKNVAPIAFLVAAMASNDDGSPFGDTVHFRNFKIVTQ